MDATLSRLFGSWSRWARLTVGGALVLLLAAAFSYYVWLGLALVIFGLLALAASWAWVELPNRYDEGPDAAERAAQERWRRMMQEE